MKINLNSDDSLPLDKMLKLCNMVIVARSVFLWGQQILSIAKKSWQFFLIAQYLWNLVRNVLWYKKTIKILDADVDNIVISKLIETKTNSKYLIGYLDKVLRPSALILPNMSRHIKAFKAQLRQI